MPAPRKYPLELRERAVRMYRTTEPNPVFRRMADLRREPCRVPRPQELGEGVLE